MKNPVRAQNLLSNVLSLGGGETLARVVAFFGTAYLARVLGPEGFGLVGFATAICGYLALSNWALNDIGARAVAKTPHEAGFVGTSVIADKLILATTGWLILVLVFPLLRLPQEARPWLHTIGIAAGTTGYNKRKPKAIALQQQEIDDNSRKSRDSQYPPRVTDHGRGHAWRQDQ